MKSVPDDLPPLSDEFRQAYRLEALLGEGGMGTVYRAHQTALNRTVAIKLLKGFSDVDAARFAREGRVLASLRHPAILAAYDFGVDGIVPYLVCELLDGETLASVIKRERLNLGRALAVLRELAGALAYAHSEGVVHRDVKPENVFVLRDGSIKLTDFGLARETAEGHTVTQAGVLLGTPGYVAPEQMKGGRPAASTDQYALGVVAFELITGGLPFQGATPVEMAVARLDRPAPRVQDRCPEVPAAVDALVAKALAREPADRFASMAEFGAAIEEVRAGLGAEADRTFRVVAKVGRGTPVHGTPHLQNTPPAARTESMDGVPRAELTISMDQVPRDEAPRAQRRTGTGPVVAVAPAATGLSGARLGAVAAGLMVGVALAVGFVTARLSAPPAPGPAAPSLAASPRIARPRFPMGPSRSGYDPVPATLPSPAPTAPPQWAELRVPRPEEDAVQCLSKWEPLAVFEKRVARGQDRVQVAADLREGARPLLAALEAMPPVAAVPIDPALARYFAVTRLRQVNHLCRALKLPMLDLRRVQIPGLRPDPIRPQHALVLSDAGTSLLAAGELAGEPFYDSPNETLLGIAPGAPRCEQIYLRLQLVSSGDMHEHDLVMLLFEQGEMKRRLMIERSFDPKEPATILTHSVPRELLPGRWKVTGRVIRPAELGDRASSEVAFVEVELRGALNARDWVPKRLPDAMPLEGCWKLDAGGRSYTFRLRDAGNGRYTGPLCPAGRGTANAWYQESGRLMVHVNYKPAPEEKRSIYKDVIASLAFENGRASGGWLGYLMTGQPTLAGLTPAACEGCPP